MSRVFQTDLNTNLHPDYFEFKHEVVPENRTEESVLSGGPNYIEKTYKEVPMYDETSKKNYASKALAGIQEVSPFSTLFFSLQNIQELQRLLRYNVYVNTNKKHIIGNQDETELVIIMRGIYLQYSKTPENYSLYKKEIERLNGLVITYLLPDLISNIEQYLGYIRDSTQNYIPMDRGVNPSIKGERTLRSVSDVLVGDDAFFGTIM